MLILKQKGQALTEYILLFTVSILLTGGLLYQFNDAFKNFVNAYFGEYLTCLIESGELPNLGWDGNGIDDSCTAEFQPFNLATGRNPINYKGTFTPSPPYQPSNKPPWVNKWTTLPKYVDPVPIYKDTGNYDSRGADGGAAGAGKGGLGAGGDGSGGPGVGGKWGGGLFGDGKNGAKGGPIALNKDEREASEGSMESTGGGFVGRYNRSKKSEERPMMVPFSRMDEEKSDGRTLRVPASKDDPAIRGKSVEAGDGTRKMKAVDGDMDAGLDFSDLFKYLLIFAIVAAMVLFLGGQALQISKSQEK
jgi:hypothetical protein